MAHDATRPPSSPSPHARPAKHPRGARKRDRSRRSGLRRDGRGIAALEYALLASFLSLAVIGGGVHFGQAEVGLFNGIGQQVAGVAAGLSQSGSVARSGTANAGGSGASGSGASGSGASGSSASGSGASGSSAGNAGSSGDQSGGNQQSSGSGDQSGQGQQGHDG